MAGRARSPQEKQRRASCSASACRAGQVQVGMNRHVGERGLRRSWVRRASSEAGLSSRKLKSQKHPQRLRRADQPRRSAPRAVRSLAPCISATNTTTAPIRRSRTNSSRNAPAAFTQLRGIGASARRGGRSKDLDLQQHRKQVPRASEGVGVARARAPPPPRGQPPQLAGASRRRGVAAPL